MGICALQYLFDSFGNYIDIFCVLSFLLQIINFNASSFFKKKCIITKGRDRVILACFKNFFQSLSVNLGVFLRSAPFEF